MTNLQKSSFIEPSPKPELDGELGLYASEIAASLGAEPAKVRRKLAERGFIDRLSSLNMTAVPFGLLNKNNGLEFTEYVLDVDAAKFFVGKWNNELGDAYLGFLIRLENKVNEFEKLAQSDPIISTLTMSMKLRQKQIEQDKRIAEIEKNTSTEAIESHVTRVLGHEDPFPKDCLRMRDIRNIFFPGISEKVVRTLLAAKRHPRGSYQKKSESGDTYISKPFKLEGIRDLANTFFEEAHIVGETEKNLIRVHYLIPSRIIQSKAKLKETEWEGKDCS